MSKPVGIALIGMGWWGKKMLNVLSAAPADIRVVRAVEPNVEAVRALCAEKNVPLSANYADALADPAVEAVGRLLVSRFIYVFQEPDHLACAGNWRQLHLRNRTGVV